MLEEIFKKIKKESLTPLEKEMGLLQLKDFISKNPVLTTSSTTNDSPEINKPPLKSPYFAIGWLSHKSMSYASVFVLFILFTGGTIFGAKSSLPGDILYPVKIHVNERLESFVTVGKEAEIEVKVKHTLGRLKEAEELSNQDRLDEKKKIEIKNNIRIQTNEISKEVREIKGKAPLDASEIDDRFDKSLDKYQAIILRLSNKTEEEVATAQESWASETVPNATQNNRINNNQSGLEEEDARSEKQIEIQFKFEQKIEPLRTESKPSVETESLLNLSI